MTKNNDATRAYDNYIVYLSGETAEMSITPQDIDKWNKTIRTALLKSAQATDEIKNALVMIKAISSVSIKSKHDNEMAMHKLCSIREYAEIALHQFSATEI